MQPRMNSTFCLIFSLFYLLFSVTVFAQVYNYVKDALYCNMPYICHKYSKIYYYYCVLKRKGN
jgi:hypothetical protein